MERTDGVARLAGPGGELEDYAAGAGRARYVAGLVGRHPQLRAALAEAIGETGQRR